MAFGFEYAHIKNHNKIIKISQIIYTKMQVVVIIYFNSVLGKYIF